MTIGAELQGHDELSSNGVRQAIIELVANDQGPSISLLDAVQRGIQDGIWTRLLRCI
jgi:hypothetical protein